jgi:hypothetical protein
LVTAAVAVVAAAVVAEEAAATVAQEGEQEARPVRRPHRLRKPREARLR